MTHISIRNPRGRNIGKALGLIALAAVEEYHMHADIAAFGAPSECHGAVSKGEARRMRDLRRRIKGLTGLKWREFRKEVTARTSDKVLYLAEQGGLIKVTPSRFPLFFR